MSEFVQEWKTFLSFVKERPNPDLKIDEYICPYCLSSDVETKGSSATLVGGRKEDDVNHVWTKCSCKSCWNSFVHEHRHNNVWYTSQGKILAGIPSCFESYIYTCSSCGGNVHRHYRELDGITKTNGFLKTAYDENDIWTKYYKVFFECENCKKSAESSIEYWYDGCEEPDKIIKKSDIEKLKCNWAIKELPPVFALNLDGVEKLEFE
jgi:hypothetical protein